MKRVDHSMTGYRILTLRKERDLTQADLSKVLGVGRTTIHGYENDIISPPPDKLLKLAEFFDVSVDYLVGNSPIRKESNKKDFQYDIGKQMQQIIETLAGQNTVYFHGKQLSPNAKHTLITFISSNMTMIKTLMQDLKD